MNTLFFILSTCITFTLCSDPLILTKYLSNPTLGQSLSEVNFPDFPTSYSGFFQIDPLKNSNTFFWFFPARKNPENAPILVWLQGGPGSSSMYGLFAENGPFSVNSALELVQRDITWNEHYSMIFIDNPVGVGFSWTDDASGYVTNEEEVGRDLYEAMTQFFQIFYQYSGNDFYVTGESYGGKYVPAFAYTIHQRNQNSTKKINLKGIAIGDGLLEAEMQFVGLSDLGYYLSLLDENERDVVKGYEERMINAFRNKDSLLAFNIFDELLNGDFFPYHTYFYNVTGNSNYFNIMDVDYPYNPYGKFLVLPSTREKLHVGDRPYHGYNHTVETYLKEDWVVTTRFQLEVLLNNYKVLIYNGQNDLILGPPLCEKFLRTLDWDHAEEYLNLKKIVWKIHPNDGNVAGFAKEIANFRQVIIRDAGHMVPLDQPERAYDMITRFIDNESFKK